MSLVGAGLVTGAVTIGLLVAVRAAFWARTRLPLPAPPPWEQGTPSPDAETDAPSGDQVLYDAAVRFLDLQVGTGDVLDTKAAGILQVGSTILPVTFGLLTVSGRPIPASTIALLALALAVYVALLVFAWRASMIRAIEFRPDLATLSHHAQTLEGRVVRRWAAEEYAASTVVNGVVLVRKARYVGVANTALLLEGLLVSLAAGATLLP